MTRPVVIYSKSAFSEWIRKYGPSSKETEDAIDVEDVDFIIFNYLTGNLMTIEAKERSGRVRMAQEDTHNVLRQLLMLSSGATVHTKRGIRPIKYQGHHLIQFENSTPDDGWAKLDGKYVTKDQMVTFLNFGRPLKRIPQTVTKE